MNKTFLMLFGILLASSAFASVCDTNYDSCITGCCSSCGSTLSTDANGDLVCNVGTEENPDTECIDACMPCSTSFQECTASLGESPSASFTSSGCCAPAFALLALLGFVCVKR